MNNQVVKSQKMTLKMISDTEKLNVAPHPREKGCHLFQIWEISAVQHFLKRLMGGFENVYDVFDVF